MSLFDSSAYERHRDLPPDPFYDEDFLDEFVEQAELEEEGIGMALPCLPSPFLASSLNFSFSETLKVDSDDEERAMALLYGDADDDEDEDEEESESHESEDGTGFKGLDAEGLDATELALERALDKHLAEEAGSEEGEGRGKGKKGKGKGKDSKFNAKNARYADWFAPLENVYAPSLPVFMHIVFNECA